MQCLADVDIPEAGNHALIQQRDLQRRRALEKLLRQRRYVESRGQRFGAKTPQCGVRVHLTWRQQRHESKAPGIVEDDDGTGGHLKEDVVMRTESASPDYTKRPRHTQMHQEDIAGP